MFQDVSDYYLARKGAKFQNLHYCYGQWPQKLAGYDAVMVMDDDIVIDATGISRLFDIRRSWTCGPCSPRFACRGR